MHEPPGGTQMPQLELQHSRPGAHVTLPQLDGGGAQSQMSQPFAPFFHPYWHASVQTTGAQVQACWVHEKPGGTHVPQLALQHSVPA